MNNLRLECKNYILNTSLNKEDKKLLDDYSADCDNVKLQKFYVFLIENLNILDKALLLFIEKIKFIKNSVENIEYLEIEQKKILSELIVSLDNANFLNLKKRFEKHQNDSTNSNEAKENLTNYIELLSANFKNGIYSSLEEVDQFFKKLI